MTSPARPEIPKSVEIFFDIETLRSLDFGEGLEKDKTIKQTSMTAEAAEAKLKYLLMNKFGIPQDWYIDQESEEEETENKLIIRPDALACIHLIYSLVARTNRLKQLQIDNDRGWISEPDTNKVLMSVNLWLNNRIERDNIYRDQIAVHGNRTNIENYWRESESGVTVNPDQFVSKEEMLKVVAIFKDRFAKK